MIKNAIVIGASSGGPIVLDQLLSLLPTNINALVVVIQHLPIEFTARMAERIDKKVEISVSQMEEGQVLQNSHAYIVPGDRHFFLLSNLTVRLITSHSLNSPSIDMGFTSVAEQFGDKTIGVVLTGMGEDGSLGCKAIKQLGGKVIVQDEESSAVFGMPKSVQISGFADEVLDPPSIGKRLIELVGTIN